MNPAQLLAWALTALGTGAAGNWMSGWLNRRKTAAEANRTTAEATKITAEAHKIDADADATRADTADHMIGNLRTEVDRQAVEIRTLRAELEAVRKATEECEAHRAADRAELAQVKAENAGFRARLDELMNDLHRREASTTGDGR